MNYRRQTDYPNVRASNHCPMCEALKTIGALTCWPCHNKCELGVTEFKAEREALLAIAEAVL